MRIERIEIDGFGRFHDVHWAFDDGLTIFLGANEAGKTTLLNAMRALLFGFEATRDGRTWYPAAAGGRRGGRLTLLTTSGDRWTVERHGERGGGGALAVRAPNGNQGGQETLDRLLHGADRDLFNNIFAFGLGELQTFASLSADGVRGRIYGAGAGLGGTSAIDLERRLRQAQDAAFLPRGRERPLNALLARIEALRAEVADLSRQPEEYEAANRERATERGRAAALREDVRRTRERAIRLGHLKSAAPIATELAAVEEELVGGDVSLDAMPDDAVAVADRLQYELREAASALAGIEEQIQAARSALAGLEVDEALLVVADEVTALRDERPGRLARADRRRELAAAEARHAAAVAEQLARTGGWEEARLLRLDDSIASIEATRQGEARLAAARASRTAAEQRRVAAADELTARRREIEPGPGEQAGVDGRIAAIRELDALRLRHGAASASRAWARPTAQVIGAAVAAAVAGLLVGLAFGRPLVGLGIGALVGVAVAVMVGRGLDRAAGPGLTAERARLLELAGLPSDADEAAIERQRDDLATHRVRRELEQERVAGLEARAGEVERIAREAARAAADLAEADGAWSSWLAEHDLPSGLSPDAARQLLAAAGSARRSAQERDHQRSLLAAEDRDEAAFGARADELLARLGRPGSDAGRRDAAIIGLAERLEQSRVADERARELAATLEGLARRQVSAAGLVVEREVAVTSHLRAVGCADAVRLRARHAAAEARRALHAKARELRASLSGIAGGHEAVAALVEEARDSDTAAVEAAHVEAQAELERIEAEERTCLSRIGGLDARISQLEVAEELGMRRQELASLEGQAAAIAREWAVRALALTLLEETRSRYERERQPDVVRAAGTHFERITGGRYARIVAPPGDASVRVETTGGESRVTDELSRGTAEQLYLALRFGLIEEFATHAEPLPVVMDDILVNFDADRAGRAATAIGDLAGRHQVLYFTCHPWTAELLDPDGRRTVALG